jgi:PPP family 3-phenylpropionic acid transporter
MVFLVVGFLMLVSHGAYYGFFSIHLERAGFGNLFMGVSWAVAIASEITVMIFAQVFLERFTMEKVLLFSLLAAVVRWGVLGLSSNAVIILLSQCLHAFTYATFHVTSILYMDKLSSRDAKTMAQSLNNSVQYGIGMMAGFFLAGYLYEVAGTDVAFITSAGISGAAFLVMWTYYVKSLGRLREPREPSG